MTPLLPSSIPDLQGAYPAAEAMADVVAGTQSLQLIAGGRSEAEVRAAIAVGYRSDKWESAEATRRELEEKFFRGYFLPLTNTPSEASPGRALHGCPDADFSLQFRVRRQLLEMDRPDGDYYIQQAFNAMWALSDMLVREAVRAAMNEPSGRLANLDRVALVAVSPNEAADIPNRGYFLTSDFRIEFRSRAN